MTTLARNLKQFSDDASSKFKGFTYEKVFYSDVKEKNEVFTIEKSL